MPPKTPNFDRDALASFTAPTGSHVRWTQEESDRLVDLYENGGDKACLTMRVIAARINRSEASCWSRLLRLVRANSKLSHARDEERIDQNKIEFSTRCRLLGIGIEANETYCKLAVARLAQGVLWPANSVVDPNPVCKDKPNP